MTDERFMEKWQQADSLSHVAQLCGMPKDKCKYWAWQLRKDGHKLKKFATGPPGRSPTSYVPTPEEIREACLEIRASWSPGLMIANLRPDWRPRAPELAEVTVYSE